MNKLGIWAIAIAISGAFLVGIFSANPIVEAQGGWKAVFDDLQSQINAIPTTSTSVIRFDSGNNQEVNINPLYLNGGSPLNNPIDFRRGSTLAGTDGTITELRYDIGASGSGGLTVTASLWKNNAVIASCSVVTATTSQSCVASLSEPVLAGDLVAVSDVSPSGSISVSFRHASVVIET